MTVPRGIGAVLGFLFLSSVVSAATYRVEPSFPEGIKPGNPLVRFSIYRDDSTAPLTASSLAFEHERLIHLLTVDSGFLRYRHEHPVEVSPGV